MRFKDRIDAGRKLSEELRKQNIDFDIVLALPRGGVTPAYIISKEFNKPLSLVITRKIGFPMNPEYAIGAVTETGDVIWDENIVSQIPKEWVESAKRNEIEEAKRIHDTYMKDFKKFGLNGKNVLIVDDGIATGFTMKASVEFVKNHDPKSVTVLSPVSPPSAVKELEEYADNVIILHSPEWFGAVGEFYDKFEQVSDEEVIYMLHEAQTVSV